LVRFFSLPNRFKPNGPLPTMFILFLLWNTRTRLKKKNKCWPLLEPSSQPNPIHIVDQVVYHKSYFVPVSFTQRCVINVKETHHQIQQRENPKIREGKNKKQQEKEREDRGSIHQIQQKQTNTHLS